MSLPAESESVAPQSAVAAPPRAGPSAANPATSYLRTKILTATPEQLQLMLYDGAIRFIDQGRAALEQKQFDRSYEALTRAQNILLELNCSLRPDVAPEMCRNLSALYTFLYLRLVEANISHDAASLEDAARLLRYQRETWVLLMQQTARHKASDVARNLAIPTGATEQVERLSIAG